MGRGRWCRHATINQEREEVSADSSIATMMLKADSNIATMMLKVNNKHQELKALVR